MRRAALLSLLAVASAGIAQPTADPPAMPAQWERRSLPEGNYLRASSADGAQKLLFMCNRARRLVAMVLLRVPGQERIAAEARSTAWLVNGQTGQTIEGDQSVSFVNEGSLTTLAAVEEGTYRALIASEAGGFAWRDGRGDRIAGFQLRMPEGRDQLTAFARECDPEFYR